MKIILEFTKTGDLIYISHLDLSRLFLRVLRMQGLRPAYSHGFNPHPKMSLVLPLSVGLNSLCELLEFETESRFSEAEIAAASEEINERLPKGLRLTGCREKPSYVSKPLASLVSAATYEFMCEGVRGAPELLSAFFGRESVIIGRHDKKTGRDVEKEIRAEMLDYRIIKDMRGRMLAEATLSALPGATLNPTVFFKAFCRASGLPEDELSPVITRTAILDKEGRPLIGMPDPEDF